MTMTMIMKTEKHTLAELAGKQETVTTPNDLMDQMYPGLAQKYGPAFNCGIKSVRKKTEAGEIEKMEIWVPTDLNERFFSAVLTDESNDVNPAVFDQDENWWYFYEPSLGFYSQVRGEVLQEQLCALMCELANYCEKNKLPIDVMPLRYKLQKTGLLSSVVTKATGTRPVRSDWWKRPAGRVPVKNGIYSIEDQMLYPHGPQWPYRGVIAVNYDPEARCPRWLELVERALPDKEDQQLLQLLFGMLLIGTNPAQIMAILHGLPQSGKGVIARIMSSLVGRENTGTLRTDHLDGRFEMGRIRHKTLLYAPDVNQNFMNTQGAHLLKAITGEDPISPEYKNSNATPPAEAIPGLPIITCNSRLRIRFEGDKEAWRRRLVVIYFGVEVPAEDRIDHFSDVLIQTEGSGILNWSLEGYGIYKNAGCRFTLTGKQLKERDELLDESESYMVFAREGVSENNGSQVTSNDAWTAYVQFCSDRGWAPVPTRTFQIGFNLAVEDLYQIGRSNDLLDRRQNTCRGWYGLKLIGKPKQYGHDLE